MPPIPIDILIGPAAGLAISLFFCFKFLKKFEEATERMAEMYQAELAACNERYQSLWNHVLKLQEQLLKLRGNNNNND